MSAIFGILRFDRDTVSTRDLERMGNTLAHRGPDGSRFMADGPVGLGHCLMRVNQEDLSERQPLFDREANLTLVADCRIDNREELAGAFGLSAADIRDLPDSAFILRAYKKWGEDCAEHLLGDFAFAMWDGRQRKLLLARDHMGQRSIHYHKAKSFFAFATEIKALWALPDVPRTLSEEQIARYILMETSPQEQTTLFDDIFGLCGGTVQTVAADGAMSIRRYWQLQCDPVHLGRDESYYIDAYRRTFAVAVECRVRRLIRPPALLLSAGYDSAAIAGLAGPALTAKGQKLITISSVLPEDYQGPLSCPRRWVELCRRDMPHLDVRYFVRRDENILTNIDRRFAAAERIPGVTHYVTDALLREAATAGARLVMDGLGGDQSLNPRGGGILAHLLRTGQFRRFLAEFGPHLRLSGHSLRQTLLNDIAWRLAPYWARRTWQAARRRFAPAWADRFIAPEFAKARIRAGSVPMSRLVRETPPNASNRAQRLDTISRSMMLTQFHLANEAAAYGLDMTRPLADKRVVELGLAIPEEFHVRNGRVRDLGCRALIDIYPREFQTRGRKQDVLDPDADAMLKTAWPRLQAETERLSTNAALRAYVDFDKLSTTFTAEVDEPKFNFELLLAVRALRAAQYIAWFRRENK
jgi:asparagine synthase (glutamine-hydrolysing)